MPDGDEAGMGAQEDESEEEIELDPFDQKHGELQDVLADAKKPGEWFAYDDLLLARLHCERGLYAVYYDQKQVGTFDVWDFSTINELYNLLKLYSDRGEEGTLPLWENEVDGSDDEEFEPGVSDLDGDKRGFM